MNISGSSGPVLGVTRWPAPSNSTASFPPVQAVNHAGRTDNFEAFYDRSFGETGRSIAAAILDRAEADLETLSRTFGRPAPAGDPFVVVLARLDDDRRSYRESRVIFCNLETTPRPESRQCSFYVAFQLAALCADRVGWDAIIGEALARALATAVYPRRIAGFATSSVWLDGGREDVFSGPLVPGLSTTGGAVLFINFLHYQLGFSWTEIVATPGPDLRSVALRLTGTGDQPEVFRSLMDSHFPVGLPARVLGDNPFPLEPPAS
jgi:hypothetical protein